MTRSVTARDTSILIVDDNKEYSQVLKKILMAALGYENVEVVNSTEEAYQRIRSAPQDFDMLFVDYHFPSGESGYGLVQKLQNERLLNDKVAFFITSEPTIEKAVEATISGMAGVVLKPFDRESLKAKIAQIEHLRQVEEATDQS